MKRFLLFLIVLLPLLSFTDPRSFVFVNPQVTNDIDAYNQALCKADLDKYRFQDKRYTMHFDGGLDVELLSANELTALNIPFQASHIRTADPEFDSKPIYKLGPNDIILEVLTRTKYK